MRIGCGGDGQDLFDLGPNPLPQLGGRALGEREYEDLRERHISAHDEIDDQMLDREGLARPGRRFNNGVVPGRDTFERRRPGEVRGHVLIPPDSRNNPNRRSITCFASSSLSGSYSSKLGTGP